jgi:hypothetical protein
VTGINTLAATEEVKAIPWIVPFLDSEDRHVRIQAGLSLNAIVATHELKRWDMSQPERIVILPPGPGDIDLRPMSWVILKMLRLPDDGNTFAVNASVLLRLNRDVLSARLKPKWSSERADTILLMLFLLVTLAIPVVGGLDAVRYGWSSLLKRYSNSRTSMSLNRMSNSLPG